MKLTTKLISMITVCFIILLVIDCLFLINREEELIEAERLNSQFELIDIIIKSSPGKSLPENFHYIEGSTSSPKADDFQRYTFKEREFLVKKETGKVWIRTLDENNKTLEIQYDDDNSITFSSIYKRTAVIIFITLILSLAIAYLIGVSIVGNPVKRILEKINKTKAGDYGYHIKTDSNDELAVIADSLNEMALEIEAAYEKIEVENSEKLEYLKQLRHADRLNTIGVLTSGIAHELGTPLNVILGHCSIVKTLSDDEKVGKSLKTIQKQVDKMSTLIKNLLSFSQKSQLKKSKNDLDEILSNCIELLSHKIKQKDIKLTFKSHSGLFVNCDKQKIEQVFINLLMNSIQALEPEGTVKISVSQDVEKTLMGETSIFHMISICDNGPGIKQEHLNKIFDPFFTTKDIGQGTGLGLSISLGIIEEHGGCIEVDSTEGKGANFYIYLPEYEESLK